MKKLALSLAVLVILASDGCAQSITGTFAVSPVGSGIVGNGSYDVGTGRLASIDITAQRNGTKFSGVANTGGGLWDGKVLGLASGTYKCWATLSYTDACGNLKQISCAPQNVTVP